LTDAVSGSRAVQNGGCNTRNFVFLEQGSLNAMRLSLTFAIIAGIMALDSLEVCKCQQGPVVEAFNGAPVMSRPAMPGMMPSASLQLAMQRLELPMLSWHGTSPSLASKLPRAKG
jgi:hypothetical protein